MKTWPQYRDDGTLASFEITSMWVTFRPLFRILKSIEGVTDIRRNGFDDRRVTFKLNDQQIAVWEPWGDNSRYLVVPTEGGSSINLHPVHEAFRRHKGPIEKLWAAISRKAQGSHVQ